MVKARDPCVAFSFITPGTRLVLGMQHLCQASCREEFRGTLSVAVLGYGVTVRVLMLHALLAKGDRSTLESAAVTATRSLPNL